MRINFFQNFSQNYKQKYEKIDYFQIKNCLITRRAGWHHPNSKSNTVLGKFEKPSRQQIGKAKDLKSKFDAGSSVQISILFHFRG